MSGPTVDRELCIGSGQCTLYAPNTFALDAEAKAHTIDPSGDPRTSIESAVEACPTRALEFTSNQ